VGSKAIQKREMQRQRETHNSLLFEVNSNETKAFSRKSAVAVADASAASPAAEASTQVLQPTTDD
jgi:hypothetical protein